MTATYDDDYDDGKPPAVIRLDDIYDHALPKKKRRLYSLLPVAREQQLAEIKCNSITRARDYMIVDNKEGPSQVKDFRREEEE